MQSSLNLSNDRWQIDTKDELNKCELHVVRAEGHFTPKNLVHLWQKSFCFQEKSIKNPYESFCSEKISYAFPISELLLGTCKGTHGPSLDWIK